MTKVFRSYPFFFLFLCTLFTFQLYYNFFYKIENFSSNKPFVVEGELVYALPSFHLAAQGKEKILYRYFFKSKDKNYLCFTHQKIEKLPVWLKAEVKGLPLKEKSNPGDSDEKNFLIEQKVQGKIALEKILFLEEKRQFLQSFQNFFQKIKEKKRKNLEEKMLSLFGKEESQLLLGMVFGEKQNFSEPIKENFKLLGLTHLLVASGANVLFVYVSLVPLSKKLGAYQKRYLFFLFCLLLYAFFTSFDASIQRAILSILVQKIAFLKRYPLAPLQNNALVAFVLLCFFPHYAVSSSFLLSCSLAFLLSYLRAPLIKEKENLTFFEKIKKNIKLYLCCQIVLIPFLAPLHSYFSIFAVLAHFFLLPFFSLLFSLAFVYSTFELCLESFSPWISHFFQPALQLLLNFLFFFLKEKIYAQHWVIFYQDCYALFPFLFYELLQKTYVLKQKKFLKFLCFSLAFFLFYQNFQTKLFTEKKYSIYFFDVGQGDSTLFRYKQKNILLDAGIPEQASKIKNNLHALGIYHIDLGIATHEDLDHMGGFSILGKEQKIKKLGLADKEGLYHQKHARGLNPRTFVSSKQLLSLWAEKEEEKKEIQKNFLYNYGLELFLPETLQEEKENESSLVFLLKKANIQFLFLADISQVEEEKYFLNKDGTCKLNTSIPLVIKLAHHGSKFSSSSRFLKACHPIFAVLSVGKANNYGHPHHSVLKLLEDLKIPYVRTDKNGAFEIFVNKENIYYRIFKGNVYGEAPRHWKKLP